MLHEFPWPSMKRLVLMCFFFVLFFSVSDDDMPCVKSVGEMFETRTAKSRPVYVCAREREGRFPCRRCQLIQTHNSSHQCVRRRHLFKDVYSAFLAFSWSFNRSFLRRRIRKNKTFSETSFWRRCCQFLWEDDVSFERNTQIILERFFCFSIIVSLHRGIFCSFVPVFTVLSLPIGRFFYFFSTFQIGESDTVELSAASRVGSSRLSTERQGRIFTWHQI